MPPLTAAELQTFRDLAKQKPANYQAGKFHQNYVYSDKQQETILQMANELLAQRKDKTTHY